MLLEEGSELILTVADVEDGAGLRFGNAFEKIEQGLATALVQSHGWFVKDQERWHLDHGTGDKAEALVGIAQSAEGFSGHIL